MQRPACSSSNLATCAPPHPTAQNTLACPACGRPAASCGALSHLQLRDEGAQGPQQARPAAIMCSLQALSRPSLCTVAAAAPSFSRGGSALAPPCRLRLRWRWEVQHRSQQPLRACNACGRWERRCAARHRGLDACDLGRRSCHGSSALAFPVLGGRQFLLLLLLPGSALGNLRRCGWDIAVGGEGRVEGAGGQEAQHLRGAWEGEAT
jgi:hypothetical protein